MTCAKTGKIKGKEFEASLELKSAFNQRKPNQTPFWKGCCTPPIFKWCANPIPGWWGTTRACLFFPDPVTWCVSSSHSRISPKLPLITVRQGRTVVSQACLFSGAWEPSEGRELDTVMGAMTAGGALRSLWEEIRASPQPFCSHLLLWPIPLSPASPDPILTSPNEVLMNC